MVWICVSRSCAGQNQGGIDCSGLAEYGAVNACFVRGVSSIAGLAVRNMVASAAGQAQYFESRDALLDADGSPNPGDFVFFKHTTLGSNEDQITHVGIYLGRYTDGTLLIVHASSRAGRVIFDKLRPGGKLTNKIAGFGDISILAP